MSNPAFVKGNKFALGKGRPKGSISKDRKNYLDIQLFAKLLWEGVAEADLTSKEKIELAFRGINTLLPKINILPTTPADSLRNAEQMAELLKNLDPPPLIEANQNGNPHP